MLKISVLAENRDGKICKGENGLSLAIKRDNNEFLIDTGLSDLFVQNAKQLNINLDKIQHIILTHGHNDHSGGIHCINDKTIILHPLCFKPRWSIRRNEFVGISISLTTLSQTNKLLLTTEPVEFCEGCYFLGEIPMITDFEKGNFATTLDKELSQIDYTEDDSGIAIKTAKGLFIITGCGHRGIVNVIKQAKKVAQEERIYGVLGGFHLRNLEQQKELIDNTIQYFEQQDIQNIYLGHCVTDDVIEYFEQKMRNTNIHRLSSGKEFLIEE